jgi:malate dehydrogenase (oxaloacetate-decarboxylating)(NADP+)
MVKDMAPAPIIFAMANPEPEISPPDCAKAARPDAIIATGRSDYPNQVNNVLWLPLHLPRRARRARDGGQRGDEDRRRLRDRRSRARAGARGSRCSPMADGASSFGPEYIIPVALRPPPDGSRVDGGSQGGDGNRRRDQQPIARSWKNIATRLRARLNPTTSVLTLAYEGSARAPQARRSLPRARRRSCCAPRSQFRDGGYGTPVLVGRDDAARQACARSASADAESFEVHNSRQFAARPGRWSTCSMSGSSAAAICAATCERMVNQRPQHLRLAAASSSARPTR